MPIRIESISNTAMMQKWRNVSRIFYLQKGKGLTVNVDDDPPADGRRNPIVGNCYTE